MSPGFTNLVQFHRETTHEEKITVVREKCTRRTFLLLRSYTDKNYRLQLQEHHYETNGMLPISLEILSIVIILAGVIVNGYILFIGSLTKQIAYVNKILLLHLGVVNTLICFTYLTFHVLSLLDLLFVVDIACVLFGLSFNIMHSAALWNLCALNFDRYFAITSPLHYAAVINTKKILVGLTCGWLISILFGLPQLLGISSYKYDVYYMFCLPNYKTPGSLVYNFGLTAFTILLPILLIFGCNMKVLMIARRQRHRIASAILEVTLSAQLTITHQRNPFFIPSFNLQTPANLKLYRHSPLSNIFQLVGCILLIYCPFYIFNLWNNIIDVIHKDRIGVDEFVETDLLIPKMILQISLVLLALSPFVNAVFYGIKNKSIKKSFYNIWRKQKSRIEIHYEIQARTPSNCGSRRPSINGTNATQPLLHRQLSETFLEIKKADIDDIQTDTKGTSDSLWSSSSKLSSFSVLNSPIGNVTHITTRPFKTTEMKFICLNPMQSSSVSHLIPPTNSSKLSKQDRNESTSKVTCDLKSTIKQYTSINTKPKIKISRALSEEKECSLSYGHRLDNASELCTTCSKSLYNFNLKENQLLVGSARFLRETQTNTSRFTKLDTVYPSIFKKYSSLQEMSIYSNFTQAGNVLK